GGRGAAPTGQASGPGMGSPSGACDDLTTPRGLTSRPTAAIRHRHDRYLPLRHRLLRAAFIAAGRSIYSTAAWPAVELRQDVPGPAALQRPRPCHRTIHSTLP